MAFARLDAHLSQQSIQDDIQHNDSDKACAYTVQSYMHALALAFDSSPSQEDIELGRISIDHVTIYIQVLKINQQCLLRLVSPVAVVDTKNKETIESLALNANYQCRGTQGGTLGISPENQTLSYTYQPVCANPWSLETQALIEHLYRVYEQVCYWQSLYKTVQSGKISSDTINFHQLTYDQHSNGLH